MRQDSDEQLVRRFQRGDTAAFEEFVERFDRERNYAAYADHLERLVADTRHRGR